MGEDAAASKNMAHQLAAILHVQGRKGRETWSQLHGKLAEVAAGASGDDPRRAVRALLKLAEDASSSQALMRALEERVSEANLKYLVFLVADELNMTPLGDSEPVHMVDEKSNFCKQNVDQIIRSSDELSARDAPYAVVSIVGAQSSGKSFLLNNLFGTRFPVMDSQRRRCQTTRGIMMSRCIGPSLLLLDVEGSDGKERGQDTLFEKRAALFALTVSDLMMVNIVTTDVGREQGGANPLFRTIFEERTKLPRGITKLLVVLRYYSGEPPLEIMRSDVLESLEEIWRSVNHESYRLRDYIEVNVVGLPDKFSSEFPKEVTALRKFLSKNISAKEPAASFSVSSSRFWDTIKQNKKLDIPSHQVAVAKLYCQQLVKETLNSLKSREEYKLLRAQESPRRFKIMAHELLQTIKNEYNLNTNRYDPGVRDIECKYLEERLHEIIKNSSMELIWKVKANTVNQFKREFDAKNIQNMEEARTDLSKYVEEFKSSCGDEKVFDSNHLRRVRGELEKELNSYADLAIKERERQDVLNAVKAGLSATMAGVSLAAGIVAASAGQVYALPAAVNAAVASTSQVFTYVGRIGGYDTPSTSQDHDCDISSSLE